MSIFQKRSLALKFGKRGIRRPWEVTTFQVRRMTIISWVTRGKSKRNQSQLIWKTTKATKASSLRWWVKIHCNEKPTRGHRTRIRLGLSQVIMQTMFVDRKRCTSRLQLKQFQNWIGCRWSISPHRNSQVVTLSYQLKIKEIVVKNKRILKI